MKRIVLIFLTIVLLVSFNVCGTLANESDENPAPDAYSPMDIFSDVFNPFGMDRPSVSTVFEASFDKGSAKFEGKSRFVLSMTCSGNMFACVAYQADVAGLSEEEKDIRIHEYLDDGFCVITGKDGRVVEIKRADPNDDRFEYVKADGAHGQTGPGCVIDIAYSVDDADIEKYTQLVRDNYRIDALTAIADYMDVATDFAECSITVNLHKGVSQTAVTYHVADAEAVRQNIAANIKSDWWEWYGNQETWISYNDDIGYKLTINTDAGAITVTQENKKVDSTLSDEAYAEVSLMKFGFGFDEAGTCGVYEEREPHYKSVAVHRPEWGEFDGDWNVEFIDSDVNGYSLRITYLADAGNYQASLEKDGVICSFRSNPTTDEKGWEEPDLDTVHRMFNDAFGTKEKELYFKPLEYFEQFVQERFGMSIDALYALPKR